ncbi:MAG TPA: hypothetical protein DCY13_10955, partial [Verrucomicrobiales bacterium]|nr:hypothetical protein [Verrucomicrobiales bacterium]
MARRTTWIAAIALALWLALLPPARAQAPNWRSFKRDTDGLPNSAPTSLTLSPRGNLWITHEDGEKITQFDGYRFQTLPAPRGRTSRIHESRSGQLWALDAAGLQFHDGEGWQSHPVDEIAAEMQNKPTRVYRPIPLLPAERQSVLVLLSDRLIKYDALQRETTLIRTSAEAGIGAFSELVPAPDDGIWITGESGAAKVPQALRQLEAPIEWKTFPLDPELRLRGLRTGADDGRGGLLVLADNALESGRALLRLRNGEWTVEPVPVDAVRYAWESSDGRLWALDVNTLRHWARPGGEARAMDDLGIRPGNLSDVAVDPAGAFWISTPAGLWRYAPPPWRPPVDAPETSEAISAIHESESGRLCFLGQTELLSLWNGKWERLQMPENTRTPRGIGTFADGTLFYADDLGAVSFDPESKSFQRHVPPAGSLVRYLGTHGGVVYFSRSSGEGTNQSLVEFDGTRWRDSTLGSPTNNIGGWTTLFAAANEEVWIGGTAGAALHQAGGWTNFLIAEGSIPAGPRVFAQLAPGSVWAGTADRLMTWDGRYWVDSVPDAGAVNEIAVGADGSPWISTEAGLLQRFEQNWIALSVDEGVPGGVLSFYEDRAGRQWIGHRRGLAMYHVDGDTDPPQTIISETPPSKQISADQVFTISFTGRDRWNSAPEGRLLFSYRIDGAAWSTFAPATRITLAGRA